MDGVLDQLAVARRAYHRTGTRNALVACLPCHSATHDAAALDEALVALPSVLRDGDLLGSDDDGRLFIVLSGVQGLPNALAVTTKIRDALTSVAPHTRELCFGVTLAGIDESRQTLVDRAIGALMLAQGAGPGRIVTSPPI